MIIAIIVVIIVAIALIVRAVQTGVDKLSESIDCNGFIGQEEE